jgi:hypothetical protein
MSTLTASAALILATVCQPTDGPRVAPTSLVQIAMQESSLRTDQVNVNRNGSRDVGLMQINEGNFALLGVTERDLLDQTIVRVRGHDVPRGACLGIDAARRLMVGLSIYNSGHPTKSLAYATKVMSRDPNVDFPPAVRSSESSARQNITASASPKRSIYDEPGDTE